MFYFSQCIPLKCCKLQLNTLSEEDSCLQLAVSVTNGEKKKEGGRKRENHRVG